MAEDDGVVVDDGVDLPAAPRSVPELSVLCRRDALLREAPQVPVHSTPGRLRTGLSTSGLPSPSSSEVSIANPLVLRRPRFPCT